MLSQIIQAVKCWLGRHPGYPYVATFKERVGDGTAFNDYCTLCKRQYKYDENGERY